MQVRFFCNGSPVAAEDVYRECVAACMTVNDRGALEPRGDRQGTKRFFSHFVVCVGECSYDFAHLYWEERGSEGYVAKYSTGTPSTSVVLKLSIRTNPQCAEASSIEGVVPCASLLLGRVQVMACARTDGFRLHDVLARHWHKGESRKVVSYYAQIGVFLAATCSRLMKAGVVPCDIKPENILVQSIKDGLLKLWLGDIDGMVTPGSRRKAVTATFMMSRASVFDSTLDAATCVFALCLTMLEYTNNMCRCTADKILLNPHAWWKQPASHPFSMEHPVVAMLLKERPCGLLATLRAPFVCAILRLANCGPALHDAAVVIKLLDDVHESFQAHTEGSVLAELAKSAM